MRKILKNTYKIYSKKKIKKNNKLNKITVVTVVYNGEDFIEKTIKNVLNQNYANLEYIVIYTPSQDRTFEIIKGYKNKIDKIIYNYDIGIYQSMNLGAQFATGKYINYMNAGDYFYNKNIISNIFNHRQNADVLYGDCKILYDNFSRFVRVKNLNNLIQGMSFSHQSCFVKTKLQREIGFQTKYYLSADHDFFLKLYNKNCSFKNLNKILSLCKSQGVVDKKRISTLCQNYLIAMENSSKQISLLDKIKMINNILYHTIVTLVKKIIRKRKLNFFLFLKYKIMKK